jgi:nitroreductase
MEPPARVPPGAIRSDGSCDPALADQVGTPAGRGSGPAPQPAAGTIPPLTTDDAARIARIAGRAPSLHNSQPWKFRASAFSLDLVADRARQMPHADETGRELLISCGAALFGLRLGLRALRYLPAVELFPDPDQPDTLARVRIIGEAAITGHEAELLAAVQHRHTHRGAFTPASVPPRLIAGMRMDAAAEQAVLTVLTSADQMAFVAELARRAASELSASPELAAETRSWARDGQTSARDGVPSFALAPDSGREAEDPGRLPQRDFGIRGTAPGDGEPPSVTAVLTTPEDSPADWIQAGQALHRMLLRAAARWVFASLQSQPMECAGVRAELRSGLGLAGYPQLVLQFGRANTAASTARRPADQTMTIDRQQR